MSIDKEEGTIKWIIKYDLIPQLLATANAEDWLNKAVKSKFITPRIVNKHKVEMLN